jgi:hypothetical protein
MRDSENTWGIHGKYAGDAWGICWGYMGNMQEMHGEHVGDILGIQQGDKPPADAASPQHQTACELRNLCGKCPVQQATDTG